MTEGSDVKAGARGGGLRPPVKIATVRCARSLSSRKPTDREVPQIRESGVFRQNG